jgi:hypothetical protein
MPLFSEHGDADEREVEPRYPWSDPPLAEIPVTVATDLLVASSDSAGIRISAIKVYSDGIEVEIVSIIKDLERARSDFGPRFGVTFADGTAITSKDFEDFAERPAGRSVTPTGGSGSGGLRYQRHWLWPLPVHGSITFVVAWPQALVPETRVSFEADIIQEAGMRVVRLWGEDRAGPP